MKKLVALLIGVAFAAGTVGMATAQTTTAPAPEKKPAEKSDMKADKKPMAKAKSASGMVKSAAADSIVVAGKEKGKDAEWTFAVDPKTTIKKSGKSITAADVKTGDSVDVRYTEDGGKAMAQSVTVKAPKMAKKDNMKKEEPKK
ncbi:MAG: hypothetical protein HY216_15040 [Candidatus Rokubacteria bacterium]|nr:hypothetical protein [Candidatus Rokubacteria bacterium]